ncbi:hypothetical protein SASPL_134116 [Salvia splendens]|uniref:Sulfotransferase n=1 Tax=Salvia splendens TaxID=180675 RepID=A0A8X8ZIR4_SALSN|nr:hypothetical protein SASPL_134116 [Salvia splendens]
MEKPDQSWSLDEATDKFCVRSIKIEEMHEVEDVHKEHGNASADMVSCTAGKKSPRVGVQGVSTGSVPLPAAAHSSRDHLRMMLFVSAVFLINRMPSKIIDNVSPFQKLYSKRPDYSALRVFGCLCYPLIRPYNKHKLESRSVKSVFLGYSGSHKGYKALLPDGRVIVSTDVFDEQVFPYPSLFPSDITDNSIFSPTVLIPSAQTDVFTVIHPSPHAPVAHSDDFSQYSPPHNSFPNRNTQHSPSASDPVSTAQSSIDIPKASFDDDHASTWKAAMHAEFVALLKNKTWILTTLPPGKYLVGCTWIFKLKLHLSGEIARHKARLVAQELSLKRPKNVMFVTFEGMLEDPHGYVKKLGDFLGCPFEEEEEEVDDIVKNCSFEVLSSYDVNKSKESTTWFSNAVQFILQKRESWRL